MMQPNAGTTPSSGTAPAGRAASLGYQGDTTAMYLVVPDAGTFDAFQQGLTAEQLATILTGAGASAGAVTMPRFKFSVGESLIPLLQALGMTDAFAPATADFSGIDGASDLSVGDVIHQADIAVDEKGPPRRRRPAVIGVALSVEVPLAVDRPFLFFIVHQPTNTLLFAGRVVDPVEGDSIAN